MSPSPRSPYGPAVGPGPGRESDPWRVPCKVRAAKRVNTGIPRLLSGPDLPTMALVPALAGSREAGGPLDERSRRRAQFLPAIRPAARRRAAAPDASSLRDLRTGTAPARGSPVRRGPPRGALRRGVRLSRRARARPALGGPELPGRLTVDSPIGAASGRPERAGGLR